MSLIIFYTFPKIQDFNISLTAVFNSGYGAYLPLQCIYNFRFDSSLDF